MKHYVATHAGNWMKKINEDMQKKANPGKSQSDDKVMKLYLYSAVNIIAKP